MSFARVSQQHRTVFLVETDEPECASMHCTRPLDGLAVSRYLGPEAGRFCSGLCAMPDIRLNDNGRYTIPRDPDQWTLAKWSADTLGSHRIILSDSLDRRWYRTHMGVAPP